MSESFPPPPPPPGGFQPMQPMQPAPGMPPAGMGAPVTRPPAMDRAVQLMRLGGVLALLSLVSLFVGRDAARAEIEDALAKSGTAVTPDMIDAGMAVGTGIGVVFGLIGAGLWFWMAAANGKGRSWARVVATVFCVISVLMTLYSVTQPGSLIGKVVNVLMMLVGVLALVHMYKPESTAFYKAASAPRY